MRLSHIENRIAQQLVLKEGIDHAVDNLVKIGYQNLTPNRVNVRITALKEQWDKFSIVNDAIGLAVNQLSPEEQLLLRRHAYFSESLFTTTYETYLEAIEQMTSFLEPVNDVPQQGPATPTTSQSSMVPAYFHHARLPRIELPKFNGSPSDWLSFKDLFNSLVLINPTLSPVEKLQYLKTSLIGSASHLLKNTTLTADNFQKAWESLIAFYENKRLLVNAAFHSLLALKRMTRESASEMEQLYANLMQIHRTFDTLQRPVDHWDDFFVFIAVQRLDSDSVKAWEQALGSSKEPPSWKQFSEFLITRLLSLQAFEKSRTGKIHHGQHSVKAHFQGKGKDHSNQQGVCAICSSNHYTSKCPQYVSKTVQQRIALISKHHMCYNCLGSHRSSLCRSVKRCFKCGKKHHTTIHDDKPVKSGAKGADESSATNTGPSTTLLATAQVTVVSHNGEAVKARVLVDQGSEISLISERLVQLLRLPRRQSVLSLVGVGGRKSNKTRGIASFNIRPHFDARCEVPVSAHILPKLTGSLPSRSVEKREWPHLEGLQLADEEFTSPGSVDILLGADIYALIIEDGCIKGGVSCPIAQRTKLGWIISGPSGARMDSPARTCHVSLDAELHGLLQRFWELETIPSYIASSLSTEEQACEQHFIRTHRRDEHGKYIVRLPFKHSAEKLGDSKYKAMRMMTTLLRKLDNTSDFSRLYSDFMQEYEQLNHMIQIPASQPEPPHQYYLPHHGVLRNNSLTTKLRVVFNGSSRTESGHSLNDILHTGAKLQIDLFDVLLRFRQPRYVFSTDIEKMYRQIKVHNDDWAFQRIFWRDQRNRVIPYQLTTVTYGLACAPFLALRTMEQLIIDEGAKFPLAAMVLKRGRYVDDIFGGSDSINETAEIVEQLTQLCTAGGFPLQKWISNHPAILKSVPPERRIESSSIQIEESTVVHTLGLCWKPSTDTFQFTINSPVTSVTTKRTILSTIAKLFDPLGLLSPVTITAKIFIQELWAQKLDWDDPLPAHLSAKWTQFLSHFPELAHLTFPRWVKSQSASKIEIHGFCDASQHALSAVVYLRSTTQDEQTTSSLWCSKTKVAPLKRLTIPRLELAGAVMLAKLIAHIVNTLDSTGIPVYMWTDSAVAYTWINNHPSRWKDFVQNRVCYIQETVPHAIWRFVPGIENPADCASRGLTPHQLSQHATWWTGPPWLLQDHSTWPSAPQLPSQRDNLEERPPRALVMASIKSVEPWNLLTRYSNLTRLLRITAWCQRAVSYFKRSSDRRTGPITISELDTAKIFWVRVTQELSFQQEINLILQGQELPKSNALVRLTPFLDSDRLLRIRGRLQSSLLPETAQHPLILPRQSVLTSLIISNAHSRTLHGGTQLTTLFIRNEYWIVGGRAPIRSFILKCVRCARYRQKRAQQIMGQLPAERVTPSRPFLHTGIDYAGPLQLKNWRGKNSRTYKAYISLFICEATSAIHLELVTDYTAEGFIAAYKRFTARRGISATLRSDCGTNLKGADSELQKLFSSRSKELEHLAALIANDGTQWIFNPPAAPHFGGKWEAGVKSVKFHLKRVIGDTLLTYEEMATLLTQIEAILNSRPLCPLSDDPDDLTALTPGHFLTGSATTTIPEPSLELIKRSHLSRWQLNCQLVESFWKRWSRECLQRHLAVYKWNRVNPSLLEGSLVLLVDERYPPSKWPLGRIIQTHPGRDGHTRVVSVRTQASVLKRPISKVCPLPISNDSPGIIR